MLKQKVRYCYALDKEGRLVNIKEAKEIMNSFICPHCKSEMIRKCGEHNEWHFAHKRKQCDYNNYLHTVAEQQIMDWFNESENVMIVIPTISNCPKYNQCKWKGYNCKKNSTRIVNLKRWFNIAEQEKELNKDGEKYRADIYCHNIKDEGKPLFIEICVTHPCEQKKRDSGIKIIEFDIKSELDIEKIISSSHIEKSEHTRYYNFETKNIDGQINEFESKKLLKFILLEPNNGSSMEYFCNDIENRKGIFEVTIDWHEGIYYFESNLVFKKSSMVAASKLFPFKSCVFCKFQEFDNQKCTIFEKIINSPMVCQYYLIVALGEYRS